MPPGPLTAVLQRLDADPPLFFDDQLGQALAGSRDRLLGLGLLRPAAPSNSAACRECGNGYTNRVVWLTDGRTGRPAPFIPCRECGPVRVPPDRLRRWAIDVPNLLAAVLAAAGGRGTPAEVVPDGRLWHLGHVTWGGRSREAYFARCVYYPVRPAVAAALAARPKAVLFLPTEASARGWATATPNPVVALESVVSLGPDGITFDPAPVESRLVEAGLAGTPGSRKKPLPKRATRAEGIDRLTREMIEHLREAREHALAMHDLKGERELLPRPTKKQLAARTRLSRSDVTRCFQDESARELRLYWQMADDLDQVLGFRGPVGGGSAT
jgi:hypothetical protein